MATLEHEESIFCSALQLVEPADRAAYLDRACGSDAPLRRRIEGLLSAYSEGAFLESPADGLTETAMARPVSERPGATIGPYKLLEQIGEGGMGLVFMAEQSQPLRRRVALKIIKPGLDTHAVIARFEAERQALALMDHPNIARVYDAGATDTGRPYFVMELVRGVPITDYCRDRELSLHERLELFIEVCQAVQHAHQKGVIHRDLKPTNILVAQSDTKPVPKVIDFGVAKATAQPLTDRTLFTHFAQIIGTPLYMSPEQADLGNQDVDTRSDVYSLGVVLYELLTGTTPFDADRLRSAGADEMRRILREEEPLKPSTRATTAAALRTVEAPQVDRKPITVSALKGDLDWIVMKALEKDRRRRYESAGSFAADVERHLNDDPVVAAAPSLLYRCRKFLRRNRSRAAMAAALLIALAAVGITAANRHFYQQQTRDQLSRRVRETLAGLYTAVESHDVALAYSRLAQAKGLLQNAKLPVASLTAEVANARIVAEKCKKDQNDFKRFNELTELSQLGMTLPGHVDEPETRALEALAIYGVLDDDNWLSKLNERLLSDAQLNEVTQGAYTTVVCLADNNIRWEANPERAQQTLELLKKAEAIREPTRVYYWVSAHAHGWLGHEDLKQQELAQSQATPGVFAIDYYLEGHTAGWHGEMDLAFDSYRNALRLQPDHFNSLFFLAMRMTSYKHDYSAAIGYYSACIALRPNHGTAYRNRGFCYLDTEQWEQAAADFTELLARRPRSESEAMLYLLRGCALTMMGHKEDARRDFESSMALYNQLLDERSEDLKVHADWHLEVIQEGINYFKPKNEFAVEEKFWRVSMRIATGFKDDDLAIKSSIAASLGDALASQGKFLEAEAAYRECLGRQGSDASASWKRFDVISRLGGALFGQKRYDDAFPLLIEGGQGLLDQRDSIPADSKVRLSQAIDRLVQAHTAIGRAEESERWRAQLPATPQ